MERDGYRVKLRVARPDVSRIAARLLSERQVTDLTIEEPPIEDVIELVFALKAPA
jgi:ABC-2 type transport system ATP-binding protein